MLPEHIYQALSIWAYGDRDVVEQEQSSSGSGQEVLSSGHDSYSASYALGNLEQIHQSIRTAWRSLIFSGTHSSVFALAPKCRWLA